jgi:hypothetical protein
MALAARLPTMLASSSSRSLKIACSSDSTAKTPTSRSRICSGMAIWVSALGRPGGGGTSSSSPAAPERSICLRTAAA